MLYIKYNNSNLSYFNQTKSQWFITTTKSIINVRNEQKEGVMLRSNCRYIDQGEKPTYYFLFGK